METTYWRSRTDDEVMQDEHEFLWRALLDTIDVELGGRRVLDAGCNRGGFLRLLADEHGIAEGFGYDPATGAIADAQRLTGSRPLHFEAASSVPAPWHGFDVAFSHEVLYLLPDLAPHAAAIHDALRPGGVYFAAMGVHSGSPLMVEWQRANRDEVQMPPLYDIDDVVATFRHAGFAVSLARLDIRFVPVVAHGQDERRSLDWLAYYYEDKVLLRFARETETRPAGDPGIEDNSVA